MCRLLARARIPCDQIPLSQDNIPFQQWQIEIGVPVVGVPNQYTYYNSYVPQFNPTPSYTEYFNQAIIGFQYTDLQLLQIASNQPSGSLPLVLQPYSPVTQWNLIKSPHLSNIAYAKTYYYAVSSLT